MVDRVSCRMRSGAPALAVCAVLGLGLTACGSSGGTAAGNFKGPVYEVTTTSISGLGTVLVDGNGYALYLYEPDHQSGKSTCYNTCAVEWAPLLVPSSSQPPIAGPGVTASKLSTTRRTDGTTEVTYNGWPLYTWAEDTRPGEATGQALNNNGGLWYVLDTAGNAVTVRP
jgi:predicted lipoprotein with Yx(FWY)xxD motif